MIAFTTTADPLRLQREASFVFLLMKKSLWSIAYGPEWRVGVFALSYTPRAIVPNEIRFTRNARSRRIV